MEMGDVSAGRIYRHVALLADSGVLTVTSEQRVRGAVERTYGLGLKTMLAPGDLDSMNREDHLQAFAAFMTSLLTSYEQYLYSGKPDLHRDDVSYSMDALWLSDREYADFVKDVKSVIVPYLKLKPTPKRKRRLIASVFMPLDNKKEDSSD